MQEQPFDPKGNGFDLSLDHIKLHFHRTNLRKKPAIAEKVGYNPTRYRQQVA